MRVFTDRQTHTLTDGKTAPILWPRPLTREVKNVMHELWNLIPLKSKAALSWCSRKPYGSQAWFKNHLAMHIHMVELYIRYMSLMIPANSVHLMAAHMMVCGYVHRVRILPGKKVFFPGQWEKPGEKVFFPHLEICLSLSWPISTLAYQSLINQWSAALLSPCQPLLGTALWK